MEAAVLPPPVDLEGHGAADRSTSRQVLEATQVDTCFKEFSGQGIRVELGVPVRPWQFADVDDDDLGSGLVEQLGELVQLTVGMPDGEELRGLGLDRHFLPASEFHPT